MFVTEKLVVIGGKGTAVNIAEHISDARQRHGALVELLGFAIDDTSLGREINGYPVVCTPRELPDQFPHPDVKYVFALYKPSCMRERVALLRSYGFPDDKFAVFVHPSSYIAPSASLGPGTVVLSNSCIQANVRIGRWSVVNSLVLIEHDTGIGDNVFLSGSTCIGSEVRIGDGVFVGLNSTVRERVALEDYAFIGMGSNVLHNLGPGQLAYGNPARRIEK